jgi:glutathione S-transferase
MTQKLLRLYRHVLSGHSHRAELMLSLLGRSVELVDVDLAKGAHKSVAFLKLNGFGQVPVLEDDGVLIADSSAILVYLALKYDASGAWYPTEPLAAARIQRWLSAAAGPLAAGPNSARLVNVFRRPLDKSKAREVAQSLFAVMELELGVEAFLAGATATIADIAMYTYTAHAPEGDVSLEPYPAVRAWLTRVETLSGFVPMKAVGAH